MKVSLNLYINYLLLLSTLLFLIGCQTIYKNGHFPDSNIIETIKNDKADKEKVINLAGSPEFISDINSNKWYYIERTVSTRLWFQPKILEQKIAIVTFDKNNLVNSVDLVCDSNNENLNIINSCIKTEKQMSNIQTFIRNIGRFNKKSTRKPKI